MKEYRLPIHDVVDDLIAALAASGRVVLSAPPGAGKTTVVPLEILSQMAPAGKIILLEPRRLAARAAAERMANTLSEPVGQTVGYRIRGQSITGPDTKIEVVTEGILTRMLQRDPELAGVSCVIFDEFHERSLNADLGLALCLETASILREDLQIVVMSATLDADPIAHLMDGAPIVQSQGRSFAVDPIWLDRPKPKDIPFATAMADQILVALSEQQGGILAFCPGEYEIRRTMAALEKRLPNRVVLRPLYGAMDFQDQRRAIDPVTEGRKVVLATAIAETSLTIQDIRTVIDGGLARRARFDPATGMSRLVTEKVSQAEATQRMGRAGRVAQGVCYKLWAKAEDGTLPKFAPAEIETSDLTSFALELAAWGAKAEDLKLLTPPHSGYLNEAYGILRMLGALDDTMRITPHGRILAKTPTHPRLAHMLNHAGQRAAPIAAILSDRDFLDRSAPIDITLRVEAVENSAKFHSARGYKTNAAILGQIKSETKRYRQVFRHDTGLSVAQMVALAYPDRIGQRRFGDAPRYLLSGGKGALMPPQEALGQAPYIVCIETDGHPQDAKIRRATAISEAELREIFSAELSACRTCEWSKRDRRVIARSQERFGAIALSDAKWTDAPEDQIAAAMIQGIRQIGFVWQPVELRFLARARLMPPPFPDFSDDTLMAELESWLLPFLQGVSSEAQWRKFDTLEALKARLSFDQMQMLDREVPGQFTTPLGRKIAIDYGTEQPTISLRLQEMFGQKSHPCIAGQPLRIELLSPAGRPVQTTMDLPGFWASSYMDVRKDMRGRYPKHPWPEDPTIADPTLRRKPQGQ